MSTTELTQKARGGLELPLQRLASAVSHVRITRRTLQVVLGLFWILDGALQLQPFMLRTSFATQVLAPVGDGQPHFVAGPVSFANVSFHVSLSPLSVPLNKPCAAVSSTTCFGIS